MDTELKGNNEIIERMFAVGAHFGYSKSRRHPSVAPFIFGAKNKVEIFDLEKTRDLLEGAKEFAKKLGQEGKTLLFIGGKPEAQEVMRAGAQSVGMPYVSGRWIGGTLTNFSEIKKRIERLEDLIKQRDNGELEKKYTKKELLLINRDIKDLETHFSGLMSMKERPDALFIIDTKKENIAFTEAQKTHKPVIALSSSDCDISEIDHPVVGNDASRASITFFVNEIVESFKKGQENPLLKEPAEKTESDKNTPTESAAQENKTKAK